MSNCDEWEANRSIATARARKWSATPVMSSGVRLHDFQQGLKKHFTHLHFVAYSAPAIGVCTALFMCVAAVPQKRQAHIVLQTQYIEGDFSRSPVLGYGLLRCYIAWVHCHGVRYQETVSKNVEMHSVKILIYHIDIIIFIYLSLYSFTYSYFARVWIKWVHE